MPWPRLSRTLTLILGALLALTAITGQVAVALDLNRFVYHRYLAYSLVALAAVHVYLHRRRLLAYLRRVKGPLPTAEAAGGQRPSPWPLTRRGFLAMGAGAVAGFAAGRWVTEPEGQGLPGGDLGLAYHQWSKAGYGGLMRTALNWGQPPPQYKAYAGARRVPLTRPTGPGRLTVEEAIERRRSRRDFADRPLSLVDLSWLLHLAQGITEPSYPFRAAPSAGALYPIEVYPVVNGVTGLAGGVYHYSVPDHALELVREGDYRLALTAFALGQEMAGQAAVTFVLTALWQRLRWKYRERSYRYALLETGHIAQNLYLGATSRGLGCVAIGAFLDDDINRLVGVDGEEESALYLVAVGPP